MNSTLTLVAAVVALSGSVHAAPITIELDVRDVAKKLLHTKLTIPASPGRFVLAYPKWLPGEHGPNGPINSMTELHITANGKPLVWSRDPVDMFQLAVDVPAGVTSIAVSFDILSPTETGIFSAGTSTTPSVAVMSWNEAILYPHGKSSDAITMQASLLLPSGWRYGTALPTTSDSGGRVVFAPVTLTTLVDSPVLAGAHLKIIPLAADARMVVGADSEGALDMPVATAAAFKKLVAEANSLFGAHHYRSYTFLYTLSDHVAHFGLEHHESSDDRGPERALVDEDLRRAYSGLLPHEMTHSWNGKYRRPAGLQPGSFEQPMNGELLWVYEGLTQYLGVVLTARSGLQTPEELRDTVALSTARMEISKGRTWRPLSDTAVAAQILYAAPDAGTYARRSVDFYPEGMLIWLEVDTIIRQKSGGKKSLDDFCRLFHGGKSGPPEVVPYDFDDVVKALGQVVEHDWRGLLTARLAATEARAPMGGLEAAGWTLGWTATPSPMFKAAEADNKIIDERYSLGLLLKEEDGTIIDVVPGAAAALAGVPPGAKLVAVDGRKWNKDRLHDAIRESKTTKRVELIVETAGEFYRTYKLVYAGGARYPQLVRNAGKTDGLAAIIAPLTKP
jgi:predicted metalloprotease with PDZ domain